MENLQNYTRYNGQDNPVDTLVDTANVHETEVLTEEELEEKEKVENGNIGGSYAEVGEGVIDVPIEESLKYIKKFEEFHS